MVVGSKLVVVGSKLWSLAAIAADGSEKWSLTTALMCRICRKYKHISMFGDVMNGCYLTDIRPTSDRHLTDILGWPGGMREGVLLILLRKIRHLISAPAYLHISDLYLSHCLARKGLAVFNRSAHSAGPGHPEIFQI